MVHNTLYDNRSMIAMTGTYLDLQQNVSSWFAVMMTLKEHSLDIGVLQLPSVSTTVQHTMHRFIEFLHWTEHNAQHISFFICWCFSCSFWTNLLVRCSFGVLFFFQFGACLHMHGLQWKMIHGQMWFERRYQLSPFFGSDFLPYDLTYISLN